MAVSAIAEGYNSVTAFFHVRDAERLIAFLRAALRAEETQDPSTPEGWYMPKSASGTRGS
jgi:hypothetical protein